MDIVEIEPAGIGVDFEMTPGIVRGGNDPVEIDVIRLALADQAPVRMRQNGNVRILNGPDDAVGLLLRGRSKCEWTAATPDPAARELVRQIEAAVVEDVDFDSLEDREAVQLVVEPIDLADLIAPGAPGRDHAPSPRAAWSVRAM